MDRVEYGVVVPIPILLLNIPLLETVKYVAVVVAKVEVAATFKVEPRYVAPVVYCVPAVVKPKEDEEVAMLTFPENRAYPEVVS